MNLSSSRPKSSTKKSSKVSAAYSKFSRAKTYSVGFEPILREKRTRRRLDTDHDYETKEGDEQFDIKKNLEVVNLASEDCKECKVELTEEMQPNNEQEKPKSSVN